MLVNDTIQQSLVSLSGPLSPLKCSTRMKFPLTRQNFSPGEISPVKNVPVPGRDNQGPTGERKRLRRSRLKVCIHHNIFK